MAISRSKKRLESDCLSNFLYPFFSSWFGTLSNNRTDNAGYTSRGSGAESRSHNHKVWQCLLTLSHPTSDRDGAAPPAPNRDRTDTVPRLYKSAGTPPMKNVKPVEDRVKVCKRFRKAFWSRYWIPSYIRILLKGSLSSALNSETSATR